MNYRSRFSFLLSGLLLFGSMQPLLGSARSEAFMAYKHNLQGRVADGRYYSYGDAFSILLPTTSKDSLIEDFYPSPSIGGVAFYNDVGFMLKVEVDELVPEAYTLIEQYPEIKEEMLDALFYDAMLHQLKLSVPRLQVLHERKIRLINGEPALFAVLDLPEAATLIDTRTGRSLDSKRGYLLFFGDSQDLVSISLQDTLSFIPSIANEAKARLNDRLLNHLLQYQTTFRMKESKRSVKLCFPDTSSPMP